MVIERISTPADLKSLSRADLETLAREIRELLIRTCASNGGHLAPNLGVVELTLALHRVPWEIQEFGDMAGTLLALRTLRREVIGA